MALVSPGIQISINDQSQYVNSNVGSVPLVVLATAQDKIYNGSIATGTTKANAGKLLAFTSQRDLINQMGTPSFQTSSSGTPVNGSETNEYGLLASYSALGLSNQLFAIRADIDLNQLIGTSVRPVAMPTDGTYWLDAPNTEWGLNILGSTSFSLLTNTLIVTAPSEVAYQTINGTANVPVPVSSIGNPGGFAISCVKPDGSNSTSLRLFYKKTVNSYNTSTPGASSTTPANTWVEVGSIDWQQSLPVTTGTLFPTSIVNGSTLTINQITVTTSGSATVSGLAASINSASIPGVVAGVSSYNQLMLFVTSDAKSNNITVDGKMIITDGTNTPLALCGVKPSSGTNNNATTLNPTGGYYCPYLFYGDYASQPSGGWLETDAQPRPQGSIWWKTSATGGGWSPALKKYNAATGQFVSITAPMYVGQATAIYDLDPIGGGVNIPHGQIISSYNISDTTYNMLRFFEQKAAITTVATTGLTTFSSSNIGNVMTLAITKPGSSALTTYTITLSNDGTLGHPTASTFISDILAAGIPYIRLTLNTTNSGTTITFTHTTGGLTYLTNVTGTPVQSAGFVTGQGTGFTLNGTSASLSNWILVTDLVNIQGSAPYSNPDSGTYWYYSNLADIDIMINDSGWSGYRNVTSDARGYDLTLTDTAGVIVSPGTQPSSQSTGAQLVAGDLWLDSGALQEGQFPYLYRYNGAAWVAIDNTDHVSSAGIVFADARWDTDGTTDVIVDSLPPVTELLTSDYIDLDAPDWRLYPRGALLFNTRRSGYNVKKFIPNYFNALSFPPAASGNAGHYPTATPQVIDAWVSASGLDDNGVMYAGLYAQRALVVAAMKSAIDSNLDVLSPVYQFNLICAPAYPEVIPNMLTLNANRGNTAFIIGDTPLDLEPNTINITEWVTNANGVGLPSDASASPYLALYYPAGRTNDLAGNQVVVPASHAVLRTFLYNDQVSYPWFAPAGVQRGLVSNLNDIGYISGEITGTFVHNGISQGLRDALFTLGINPITQLPGVGLVVFGQLTRSGDTTSRNRINVVRLENYLRTVFNSVANGYLFEPNDGVTRKSIAAQIESSLHNVLANRGLYDFLVICDASNNTSATISNNQLYVDVAIEPMKDVEFIYIPIAIYNPGTIAALNTTST